MKLSVSGVKKMNSMLSLYNSEASYIGLIFIKSHPEHLYLYNSKQGTIPDFSEEKYQEMMGHQVKGLNHTTKGRIGIFHKPTIQIIMTVVFNFNVDYIQINGDKNPIFFENLLRTLKPDFKSDIKLIKGIQISDINDVLQYKQYENLVDMFCFYLDSPEPEKLELLNAYKGELPFILNANFTPTDTERITQIRHPGLHAIDICGHFINENGDVDTQSIADFYNKINTQ